MTLAFFNVPKKTWWKLPFKVVGFLILVGGTASVCAIVLLYFGMVPGMPAIPRVGAYLPPIVSEMYTQDGVLAGELYNERRKVVPYDRIPKRLVQAFVAAEDADFFEHRGIDPWSLARAAVKSAIAKITGRGRIQGGSTLTQQTAKAVLISKEGYKASTAKNLRRKFREALLALELERTLSKQQILFLYLNNVYLGHQAYGVQSAAENYFRKDVKDLTLAEMALIAGFPQAPSMYSPFRNPAAAIERRKYVLGQMLDKGMIGRAEYATALDAEVKVYPVEDVFHQFAPYFSEEVRRELVARYGNATLLNDGLRIFTTMDSEKQRAAQDAVLNGLLAVDKRQGYRGPLDHLGSAAERLAFIDRSKRALGDERLTAGRYYVGLVTAISADKLVADVNVGGKMAKLPGLGMRWARPVNPERTYSSALINRVSPPLTVGDVVIVRAVAKARDLVDDTETWSATLATSLPSDATLVRLEQDPEPQAALVSIEPNRQYMVAMVGGYDFDANEFNRAFQACRQPGSSFKPLVYASAIDQLGWTQGTVIVDSPIVYDDPTNQSRWKPENYEVTFRGEVLLRDALVFSMNIPAVKTFIEVTRAMGNRDEGLGMKKFAQYLRALGISNHADTDGDHMADSPINLNYSSALGSSCVFPYELTQVYATFDRGGVRRPTYFVRKVEDRYGRTVDDHTAYDDPWASLGDRLAAGYARLSEPGQRVLKEDSTFLLVDLLRHVVLEGTGFPASKLGKPAAGKTGTTNDAFDAWFVGFTKDLVTAAWVGYDLNPHPLGRYETGGRAALPIWLSYMGQALDGRRQPDFAPPSLSDTEFVEVRVDRQTGQLSSSGRDAVMAWYKKGTEPTDVAPPKGQVDSSEFLQVP